MNLSTLFEFSTGFVMCAAITALESEHYIHAAGLGVLGLLLLAAAREASE